MSEAPLPRVVGISISDSPDLADLGLGTPHLNHAYLEMARMLLSNQKIVAYGGDHREAGFTEQLFSLVRTYPHPGQSDRERSVNYLAWPLHLNLSKERRVALLDVARIIECDLPEEVRSAKELMIDRNVYLPPTTPQAQFAWAKSLTLMRERMNREIDARVLLGGIVKGYKGIFPGVVEEAQIALRSKKPTFLLGGFGGATKAVIDAVVEKKLPERLTRVYQRSQQGSPVSYAEFMDFHDRQPKCSIDFGQLEKDLAVGIAGLHNGLSEKDNKRLFTTNDVDEMVALVLRGLNVCFPSK